MFCELLGVFWLQGKKKKGGTSGTTDFRRLISLVVDAFSCPFSVDGELLPPAPA